MTRLVLVHGRDNQGLDAEEVERTWRTVLSAGLAAAGRPRVLTDDDATFVFYGDTLAALVGGSDGAPAPPVTVHATTGTRATPARPRGARGRGRVETPDDELAFLAAVATEVLLAAGVEERRVAELATPSGAVAGATLDDLGGWVNALLSALDRFVPGLSAAVLVLLVRDVWAYLHDPEVRATLDDALAAAMPADEPAVVVAHSLGSVVAYAVLRERPEARSWDVPLFCTLGSPLAVRAIRDVLAARAPLRVPATVRRWVAVRDPRDALALHGLGASAFPLAPGSAPVEDLVVRNEAPGHHAAAVVLDDGRRAGYLAVPEVARAVDGPCPRGRARVREVEPRFAR